MNSTVRRLRGRPLLVLAVVLILTVAGAIVLVGPVIDPGGDGVLGTLADWLSSDTFRGAVLALGSASLVAGLLSGLAALGVARFRGYSWAPARVLGARLLGRPAERVDRYAAVGVHLLVSVVLLFVVGALYLAGSILVAVFAPPQVSMFGGGVLAVGALLLVTVAAGWWVLATRWLPAATRETDETAGALRRQAAVVLATYVVVATFSYPVVLFASMMLVFFR
jgi:hypothetical protein